MLVLRGEVTSGRGGFGQWIEKLQDHYERKTGMRLFPGTLNLRLSKPFSLSGDVIRLEKEEHGGRVSVSMIPCRILGREAFILRTDQNENGSGHHPKTILEIATDVKLREAFGLMDGDTVEVEIPDK